MFSRVSNKEMKKQSIQLKEHKCRLCAAKGINYVPLFGKNTAILKKIKFLLPIKIKPGDELPSHICHSCDISLNVSHRFHTVAIKTNKMFHQQLQSKRLAEEIKRKSNERNQDSNKPDETAVDEIIIIDIIDSPSGKQKQPAPKQVGMTPNDDVTNEGTSKVQKVLPNVHEKDVQSPMPKAQPTDPDVKESEINAKLKSKTLEKASTFDNEAIHCTAICNECGKKLPERSSRKKFKLIFHNLGTPCKECGQYSNITDGSRNSSSYLFRGASLRKSPTHKSSDEAGKKLQCRHCKKSFKTAKKYTEHQATHKMLKPHCDLCNKYFSTTGARKLHMVLHDPPETWKYRCALCGEQFPYLTIFKSHRKAHKRPRKVGCDMCTQMFSSSAALNAHKYYRHFDSVSPKKR